MHIDVRDLEIVEVFTRRLEPEASVEPDRYCRNYRRIK